MPFTFSIRTALKDSWNIFAQHAVFFMTLSFVMMIFSIFYNTHQSAHSTLGILGMVLVIIAIVLWSYVWISAALAAIDGKHELLQLRSLAVHMPTARQFIMIVLISLIVGIIVGLGFILLIIPGIYFMVRLAFANTAYVDRQQGLKQSLEYSWHLVKGKIFWTVLLVLIIEIILVIIGAFTLMIGSLITYPIAMLLLTHLYRALTIHQRNNPTPEKVATA